LGGDKDDGILTKRCMVHEHKEHTVNVLRRGGGTADERISSTEGIG